MSLTDDLRKIVLPPGRGTGRLGTIAARGAIGASRGVAELEVAGGVSGGGIASPLTEIAGIRSYHAEQELKSSDGLFVIVYRPIKNTLFRDANAQQVEVEYTDEVQP